jgi:hypothetical protein
LHRIAIAFASDCRHRFNRLAIQPMRQRLASDVVRKLATRIVGERMHLGEDIV